MYCCNLPKQLHYLKADQLHVLFAQESLITSVVFLGTMIGANTWGALSDARGRRVGFQACAMFIFVFGMASAAAPSYGVHTAILDAASLPHHRIAGRWSPDFCRQAACPAVLTGALMQQIRLLHIKEHLLRT